MRTFQGIAGLKNDPNGAFFSTCNIKGRRNNAPSNYSFMEIYVCSTSESKSQFFVIINIFKSVEIKKKKLLNLHERCYNNDEDESMHFVR